RDLRARRALLREAPRRRAPASVSRAVRGRDGDRARGGVHGTVGGLHRGHGCRRGGTPGLRGERRRHPCLARHAAPARARGSPRMSVIPAGRGARIGTEEPPTPALPPSGGGRWPLAHSRLEALLGLAIAVALAAKNVAEIR